MMNKPQKSISRKSIQLFVLLGMLLISITSYKSQNQSVEEKAKNLLTDFYQSDTITFTTTYRECGEWGGHLEKIIVTKKHRTIYADLFIFPINCDSVFYDSYLNYLIPMTTMKVKITKDNLNCILDYVNSLTFSNLSRKSFSHANRLYKVVNSDSTLLISVRSVDEVDERKYDTFKNCLDFK